MPAGQAVSRFGPGIFFFFVVVKNLHINYTGCPQGRPCLGLGRVSLFFFSFVVVTNLHINFALNSSLSHKGCIVLIVFNKSGPMKIYYWRVYHEGGEPLIPTCVTSNHHLIYSLNLDSILLPWWRPYCLQVLDSNTPFSKRK